MARGFLVKRETAKGTFVERAYELRGDEIVLLANPRIRIPANSLGDPHQLIAQHEKKTWSTLTGLLEISEFESNRGSYFPSIARPLDQNLDEMHNPNAAAENELAKTYRRENSPMTNDIEACFEVASPTIVNYQTYGTEFEKIIYFACVGVESLFVKILADNGHLTQHAGTRTFARLKSVLRIDEYEIGLVYYPWMPLLQPFFGWDIARASKSLAWFDAYNSLKHDKQKNRHKATMENALNAVAAHYIMTFAVFGNQMFDGYLSDRFFFHLGRKPNWQVAENYFTPPSGGTWQTRKLVI